MERSLWNTLAFPLLQVFAPRAKVLSQAHETSAIFLGLEILGIHVSLQFMVFNTVSQKKGSSSGDQFQIFQIFCYGVMGRDGLTTLRPKKVRPDPLAGRPGPL